MQVPDELQLVEMDNTQNTQARPSQHKKQLELKHDVTMQVTRMWTRLNYYNDKTMLVDLVKSC